MCSNAGGEQINEMTLDLWRAHRDREEISLQDAESAISKAVFENPQSESLEVFLAGSRAQQRELGPFHAATDAAWHLPSRPKGTGIWREGNCNPLKVSWQREGTARLPKPADLLTRLAHFFGDVRSQPRDGSQHSTLTEKCQSPLPAWISSL